jgi:hypothetical protein
MVVVWSCFVCIFLNIFCSWTIGHVNEQPNWYVAQRMAPYGFEWEPSMTEALNKVAGSRKGAVMAFRRVN